MKTIFKKGDWFKVKPNMRPAQITRPAMAKLATRMGYIKSSAEEADEFDKKGK